MNVTTKISLGNNHSIEWGESTWDENEFSIRNRYDTIDGRFNKSGSSEISWEDFNLMIIESIRRNLFSPDEINLMQDEINKKTNKNI